MTALDAFTPEGELIHPFDLFLLLSSTPCMVEKVRECPEPENEADYLRNITKIGSEISVNGKRYFETTSWPPTEAGRRAVKV